MELEAQDGTLHRIQSETARVTAAQAALTKEGDKLRSSLVTPQSEYADALARANRLLNAEEISEAEYAMAVDKARLALEAQDGTLKKVQADQARVTASQAAMASEGRKLRDSLVTPQSEYADALARANQLLNAEEISEAEYAMAVDKARIALEAQDGTLKRVQADMARVNAAQAEMTNLGTRIRASLVTPQTEYADALKEANQALQAEEISEAEYAMAVDKAKTALDAKDVSLQKNLADAKRMNEAAVTPEKRHADAIAYAKQQLDKKLISQKAYDLELKNQNALLQDGIQKQNAMGDSVLSTAGQFASQLTGISGILGTATAIVGTLRAEYDNLLERQKNSADRQLDTAGAQRTAIFALGEDPNTSADALSARAEAAALKFGKTVKEVYDAYGNSLSARGELLAAAALDSADMAMATSPHHGATEIAGSLVGMKRKFGGQDDQLMGLNLAGQQVSRVKDQASFAANVVPTIIGLGGYGNSAREATALPAALSVAMEDLMGRQSATAAEKIAAQLKLAHEKYKTGLTSTADQIAYLQSDAGDKMRKELIGNGKGKKGTMDIESGALIATTELLSKGNNKTKDAYKSALETVPELDKAGAYYEQSMKRVNSQKLQQQSDRDRTLKAGADKLAVGDDSGARTSIAREGLDKALQGAGAGYMERFVQARLFNIGGGTEKDAAFALSNKAAELRNPTEGSWNPFASRKRRDPTADELRRADDLQQTADKLSGIKRNAKGQIYERNGKPVGLGGQPERTGFGGPDAEEGKPVGAPPPPGPRPGGLPAPNGAPAAPPTADDIRANTAALVANTQATAQNTEKPAAGGKPKPVNQPVKPRPSAKLENERK